jgi:hypothetical protein
MKKDVENYCETYALIERKVWRHTEKHSSKLVFQICKLLHAIYLTYVIEPFFLLPLNLNSYP